MCLDVIRNGIVLFLKFFQFFVCVEIVTQTKSIILIISLIVKQVNLDIFISGTLDLPFALLQGARFPDEHAEQYDIVIKHFFDGGTFD